VKKNPSDGSGTGHGHVVEVELLILKNNGQFPDESVRINVVRIHYVTSQTYYEQES
jgi:hypothetical protein